MERDRGGRPRHPDVLTPAEWRVLEELRRGGTNAEIAVRLGVSPDAVKYHTSNMLGKLGLDDRHELAGWQPKGRGPHRLGFLTLPAGAASLERPLLRAVGGLMAAAVVTAVTVFAIAACGDGEPPEDPASGEAARGVAVIGQADVRYVSELCLALTSLTDAGREAAGRWGVDFDTWGEDVGNIPDDQLGEFSSEVLVEPWKKHGRDLERIVAPPGVEEFHTAAVTYRIERIEALSPLLEFFPSEGNSEGPSIVQAYARLLAGIGEIYLGAPTASVELRSRLFGAAEKAPACTDTEQLAVFLGGGEPTLEPSATDRRYLQDLCSGGRQFEASVVNLLPALNGRLSTEERAQLVAKLVDAMAALLATLRTASPADDVAPHHLDFLEVLDEALVTYRSWAEQLEQDGSIPNVSLEEFTRLQRAFSAEGEPTAPPEARARLLEAANSVEECAGSGFLPIFLGTDEE